VIKEEFELRKRQWAEMNRWEREQSPEEHSPEWLLAAIGALYELLPESTRAEEPDPERRGIQRMNQILELLSRQ
jgi:hypothetical protein